jgi:phosphoribosyl 1,2-cyclic phosphodiesterase
MGSNTLLLDAGVKTLEEIIKETNLNDITFAFISHEHIDHSRLQEKLDLRGVYIIDGKLIQDFTEMPLNSRFSGLNSIYAFNVEHGKNENDRVNCAGLIVQSENECLLYITDFNLCEWDLSDFEFTHVMVECNYIKLLALASNDYMRASENIYRHRELDGTINFLKSLNLSKCEEIILMHLSTSFSNPIVMGSKVYKEFGIRTGVCRSKGGIDYYG